MATNNSSNQDYTNNSDGFTLGGGTTERELSVTGGDVTLTGSGSAVMTYPASDTTLVGRDTVDALTYKDVSSSTNTFPSTLLSAVSGGSKVQSGWSYIQGDGTDSLSKAITFPTAYSAAPLVIVGFIGAVHTSSGAPANPSSFTTSWGNFAGSYSLSATTTGFTAELNASAAHSSSYYFGFLWVALELPA